LGVGADHDGYCLKEETRTNEGKLKESDKEVEKQDPERRRQGETERQLTSFLHRKGAEGGT